MGEAAVVYALGERLSSPKRCVKTLANENPATCQNQTLVTRKPTPSASRPLKEIASAERAIDQARQ
jgi:hypothetical protein